MSMQINQLVSRAQIIFPIALLFVVTAAAIWQGIQTTPLSSGRVLMLHPALTTKPSEVTQKVVSGVAPPGSAEAADPFFRVESKVVVEQELIAETEELREINLTTIAAGKKGRYCLVNGTIFWEGQSGDGFTVKAILASGVTFQVGNEEFALVPGQKAALKGGKLISIEDMVASQRADKSERLSADSDAIEGNSP